MRLYGEIFKGADGLLARCLLIPCGGGYFEGVKSVTEFSPKKILLRFAAHDVTIEGENLSIGKFYGGDLQLCGKITLWQAVPTYPPKGGRA